MKCFTSVIALSLLMVELLTAVNASNSCAGKCNSDYDRGLQCQCNSRCPEFSNCCSDYNSLCLSGGGSCSGRCGQSLNPAETCQCNTDCLRFGDCCPNYQSMCTDSGPDSGTPSPNPDGTITDEELLALGNMLWEADTNRFSNADLVLDVQSKTTASSSEDRADRRLFSYVNELILSEPSYANFIALLDNYNTPTGQREPELTQAEQDETDRFLNHVLNTQVMMIVNQFLVDEGKLQTGEMKEVLYNLWFAFYGRSSKSTFTDSSGFEHVFVGEHKSGKVTGFHSWVQMYLLEKNGRLDYMGYNAKSEPDLMDNHFKWDNLEKQRGSMFMGTSPEFDLAIYTLCMIARPGQTCTTTIQGASFSMQTYDVSHVTGLQVASAFPMVRENFK